MVTFLISDDLEVQRLLQGCPYFNVDTQRTSPYYGTVLMRGRRVFEVRRLSEKIWYWSEMGCDTSLVRSRN